MADKIFDCSRARNSALTAKLTALERRDDAGSYLARHDVERRLAVLPYAVIGAADLARLWPAPALVAPFGAALAYADIRSRERRPLANTTRLPARQWQRLARAGLAAATPGGWKLRARTGPGVGWLTTAEAGLAGFRDRLPARGWLVLALAREAGAEAPGVIESVTGDRLAGAAAADLLAALAAGGWYRGALRRGMRPPVGQPLPDGCEHGPAFRQARNRRGSATAAAGVRWRGHESAAAEAARLGVSVRTVERRRQAARASGGMPAGRGGGMPAGEGGGMPAEGMAECQPGERYSLLGTGPWRCVCGLHPAPLPSLQPMCPVCGRERVSKEGKR